MHLIQFLKYGALIINSADIQQVVYVARNPKDVIVSFFHHHKLIKIHKFTGDINLFADYFMKDEGNKPYYYILMALTHFHNVSNTFSFLLAFFPTHSGGLDET